MKKGKILIVILTITIILLLILIFYLNVTNPDLNNVSLSIKKDSVTSTGATIIINDKNFLTTTYSFDKYLIDKKIGSEWQMLPYTDNKISTFIAFEPPFIPHTLEKTLDWSYNYGELDPGTYRIRFQPTSYNKYLPYGTTLTIEFILN